MRNQIFRSQFAITMMPTMAREMGNKGKNRENPISQSVKRNAPHTNTQNYRTNFFISKLKDCKTDVRFGGFIPYFHSNRAFNRYRNSWKCFRCFFAQFFFFAFLDREEFRGACSIKLPQILHKGITHPKPETAHL